MAFRSTYCLLQSVVMGYIEGVRYTDSSGSCPTVIPGAAPYSRRCVQPAVDQVVDICYYILSRALRTEIKGSAIQSACCWWPHIVK